MEKMRSKLEAEAKIMDPPSLQMLDIFSAS